MHRYLSPLRYPGGKATLAPWLGELFAEQAGRMDIEIWMEPFAGGAGAALALLEQDIIGEAWLIDQNPAIATFWATVMNDTEVFAARIERTTPTIEPWETSRAILAAPDAAGRFELAYAAFIVNRCSRSGMITASSGPIGGKSQSGPWAISSRFNVKALADRIRHVGAHRGRIRTLYGDGISFVEELRGSGVSDEVFLFVDPPYIAEGNRLYAHGMDQAAHQRLADALNSTDARWLLTYDNHPDVRERLYPQRRVIDYSIRNTTGKARRATELAVLSDNLQFDAIGIPAHA